MPLIPLVAPWLKEARIDSSGRLGIGSTNPSQTLDVNGNANISGLTSTGILKVAIIGSSLAANPRIAIGTDLSSSEFGCSIVVKNAANSARTEIISDYVGTQKIPLVLQPPSGIGIGLVGIGSTNPQYKLDISEGSSTTVARIRSGPSNVSSAHLILQHSSVSGNNPIKEFHFGVA